MKITDISIQAKNKDRVNVSVDGKYRFSLDVFQVGELGLKKDKEYSEEELVALEQESTFGKLYMRALEYVMMRPHSAKEIRDYLWRKTLTRRVQSHQPHHKDGARAIIEKPGVSKEITERVYQRLADKGYVDDEKFARFWVENRNQTKGASQRKLLAELRSKGVEQGIITTSLSTSLRSDEGELIKVIAKKASRYPDRNKLITYLLRQGFRYDDIIPALNVHDQAED